MNYPFRNAAVAFARGEDANAVGEQIMSICENYPKPALDCAMNFLSTHDTCLLYTSRPPSSAA